MTNEEASFFLANADRTDFDEFMNEALDIAIKLLDQLPDIKAVYDKGYKDGQEALAVHLELCKDEGSIIEIPKNATNGEVIKAVFPSAEVFSQNRYEIETNKITVKINSKLFQVDLDLWNALYREKEPTVEQGLSYTDESGLQSAT